MTMKTTRQSIVSHQRNAVTRMMIVFWIVNFILSGHFIYSFMRFSPPPPPPPLRRYDSGWTLNKNRNHRIVQSPTKRSIEQKIWLGILNLKNQKRKNDDILVDGNPTLTEPIIRARGNNDIADQDVNLPSVDDIGRTNDTRQEQMWKEHKIKWAGAFQRLLKYKEIHGHVDIPHRYNDGIQPHLGSWVVRQRQKYWEKRLSGKRKRQLETVGFKWRVGFYKNDIWMDSFGELKFFKQKYNSTKVPISNMKSMDIDFPFTKLGLWASLQRVQYNRFLQNRTSYMTMERKELLDSIEFALNLSRDTDHEKWLQKYFQLYIHWYQYNTSNFSDADGVNARLNKWVGQQKQRYEKGMLPQGKVDLLNEIGFEWTKPPPPPTWEEMFDELKAYHDKFGTTLINSKVNPTLSGWTSKQRSAYGEKKVAADKCKKLDNLGFDWIPPKDINWHAMADRLVAYKNKYNNTMVEQAYREDKPLANWVRKQRGLYASYFENGTEYDNALIQRIAIENSNPTGPGKILSPETVAARICRLIDLGFVWDAHEEHWMEMYSRLVIYQNKHNTTLVPPTYKDDQELAIWVLAQRSNRRGTGKVEKYSERKIDLLNEIGFIWDPNEVKWYEQYEQLVQYTKEFGTTEIPYRSNDPLSFWVYKQQKYYLDNTLSLERIEKLNAIGFVWRDKIAFLEL